MGGVTKEDRMELTFSYEHWSWDIARVKNRPYDNSPGGRSPSTGWKIDDRILAGQLSTLRFFPASFQVGLDCLFAEVLALGFKNRFYLTNIFPIMP